jgi:hypothetical protein
MLWDQVSNAPLPIRSVNRIGLGAACDNYPIGLTKSELERYAKECGTEKACQYVSKQTGIDVSGWCKGDLTDWKAVSKNAFTYYTGVNADDALGLIDSDGNIDFKSGFQLGGSIAAAAVCTAYGLSAVAPICGKLGSYIGGVIYEIGGQIVDAIGGIFSNGGEYIAFQPDASWAIKHAYGFFSGRYEYDDGYFAKTKMTDYTSRVFAIRSLSVTTISILDNVSKFWLKASKEKTGKEEFIPVKDIFERFVKNGLVLPRCWTDVFKADENGGWEWGDSPNGTEFGWTEMWPFLAALQTERPPRFWWDIYSSKIDEDPSRYGDLEYRINTISSLKACTPNYPFKSIAADGYDNSQYSDEITSKDACDNPKMAFCCWKGQEWNSGGIEHNHPNLICPEENDWFPLSCWKVICGGQPIYLKAVSFNGDNLLYMSDMTCIEKGFKSGNKIKSCSEYRLLIDPTLGTVPGHVAGHSVVEIKSTTALDFWCYLVSKDHFQSMINLWAETLESATQAILAQMRNTLLGKTTSISMGSKPLFSKPLFSNSGIIDRLAPEDHTVRNVLIGTVLIGSGITAYVYRNQIKSWWNK